MKTVTVYLDDGNEVTTSINGSNKEITDYYKSYVHVTECDVTGKETKTHVVSLKICGEPISQPTLPCSK
jgi:hypothetical protein